MGGVDWTSVVVLVLAVLALSLIVTSLVPHRPRKRPDPGPEQQ